MKDDVLRLQIVVDYLLLLFIQVLQPTQNLRNYELSLLLRDLSVLLQVKVEVRARAKLKNSAKAVVINLDGVKLFDDSPVVQILVDLVLPYCMLDVIVLDLLRPAVVEVVDFAGDLPTVFEVEGFVDLGEASLAQNGQDEVLIVQHCESLAPVDAAVLGLLFVADALVLDQVGALLFLEHLELLANAPLLVLEQLELELVDLTLLILVNVIELTLFKVKFAVFIDERQPAALFLGVEPICGHRGLAVDIAALLLDLLGFLFQLFYLFFLTLDLSEPSLQFEYRLALFPHIDDFGTLSDRRDPAKLNALLIEPHAAFLSVLVLQLSKVLDHRVCVYALHALVLL